jgi:hypothetical protein
MAIKRYPREIKKLSDLKKADYNPRTITDTAKHGMKASLQAFGDLQPIVWNKRTGNIVSGHQRYDILTELGEKEAEVIIVDFDDQTEKKANLEMNNQSITGDWDEPKLADLLDELKLDTDYEPLLLHDLEPADLNNTTPAKKYDLVPFEKTHFLLSTDLETATEFSSDLNDLLKKYPQVEIELGSN